jgi:hypothetical protein
MHLSLQQVLDAALMGFRDEQQATMSFEYSAKEISGVAACAWHGGADFPVRFT